MPILPDVGSYHREGSKTKGDIMGCIMLRIDSGAEETPTVHNEWETYPGFRECISQHIHPSHSNEMRILSKNPDCPWPINLTVHCTLARPLKTSRATPDFIHPGHGTTRFPMNRKEDLTQDTEALEGILNCVALLGNAGARRL